MALLLLVQAPPALDDDIVAIGKRLDSWSGQVIEARGVRRCQTVDSTGDAEIDRIGCKALSDCLLAAKPRIQAIAKAYKDKDERIKAMEPVQREVGACLDTTRTGLIADYVTRKRAETKR